jgi:hypothetical protein
MDWPGGLSYLAEDNPGSEETTVLEYVILLIL